MGQFGKIPDFIILKKVRLKPTERDIYEYLCFRRNEKTGKCFPSVSRIAADLGIKQRHVYEARAALKELGLISWRKDERGRCHYTLHPPPAEISQAEIRQDAENDQPPPDETRHKTPDEIGQANIEVSEPLNIESLSKEKSDSFEKGLPEEGGSKPEQKPRKTYMPEGWKPSEEAWHDVEKIGYHPEKILPDFRDHNNANAVKSADWDASFRTFASTRKNRGITRGKRRTITELAG